MIVINFEQSNCYFRSLYKEKYNKTELKSFEILIKSETKFFSIQKLFQKTFFNLCNFNYNNYKNYIIIM